MKIAFACITFLALSFLAFSQKTDIELLKSINLGRNRNYDPIFRFITDSVSPFNIGVALLILIFGRIQKDRLISSKAYTIFGSILLASLISTILKYSIDRPRPFITYTFIEKVTSGGSPSFPSGHSTDAFALAAALSLAFPRWYVLIPSFLWALAIGFSRINLGVHYPSDVLAGALIGVGSAYLFRYLKAFFSKNTAVQ